jgi:hypothetical protein
MSAKLASKRSEVTVAQYLTFQLDATHKTQREIASEIGYDKSNIITMFKQGLTRVPLSTAPKLARAIGVDPIYFLRLCMREYTPEILEAVEATIGAFPTQNESKMLSILREVTDEQDPPIATKVQEETLRQTFKNLFA